MNQDQNNIFVGVQPVPPMQGGTVSNLNNNSFIPPVVSSVGNEVNNSTIVPSVMPVLNDVSSVNQAPIEAPGVGVSNPARSVGIVTGNEMSVNSNPSVIPVAPISGVVDNLSGINSLPANDVNSTAQNSVSSSELKIENASPFDIGVSNNTSFVQLPVSNSSVSEVSNVSQPMPMSNLNSNLGMNASTNSVENSSFVGTSVSNGETPANNASEVNKKEVPLTNAQSTNNNASDDGRVVSVGKYLGHILLFSIPVIGFIMLIVKVFDKKDKNISNFAKAQLILTFLVVVLVVIISILLSPVLISMINTINDNSNETVGNNINTVYDDYYEDVDDSDVFP